jgi:hypothetical protein
MSGEFFDEVDEDKAKSRRFVESKAREGILHELENPSLTEEERKVLEEALERIDKAE